MPDPCFPKLLKTSEKLQLQRYYLHCKVSFRALNVFYTWINLWEYKINLEDIIKQVDDLYLYNRIHDNTDCVLQKAIRIRATSLACKIKQTCMKEI